MQAAVAAFLIAQAAAAEVKGTFDTGSTVLDDESPESNDDQFWEAELAKEAADGWGWFNWGEKDPGDWCLFICVLVAVLLSVGLLCGIICCCARRCCCSHLAPSSDNSVIDIVIRPHPPDPEPSPDTPIDPPMPGATVPPPAEPLVLHTTVKLLREVGCQTEEDLSDQKALQERLRRTAEDLSHQKALQERHRRTAEALSHQNFVQEQRVAEAAGVRAALQAAVAKLEDSSQAAAQQAQEAELEAQRAQSDLRHMGERLAALADRSCTVCRRVAEPQLRDSRDRQNLQLTPLPPTDNLHILVASLLRSSLPRATGITVVHIQNRYLDLQYRTRMRLLKEKNGEESDVLLLWHGTRGVDPSEIYNGESGFDPSFSNEGLWGQAVYLSTTAQYSDSGYVHRLPDGRRQLLLAEAAVGRSVQHPADSKLRRPPELPHDLRQQGGAAIQRYDSVNGITCGTQVYMVYEKSQTYPRYLVEYSLP
eukprot:TRINITY_DN23438_c0_g1_i1.p1 TRINITY_DN23438_c0_g1~~TRINITY_DN23438_c0_g1_i1.p1  ORF type:complete len:506 (+),score=102.55 TRINITY_DN23438_c0_g1_i1:82-1518(+)